MDWETRVHWWWGFFLPARWCMALITLSGLGLLTFTRWGIAIAICLAMISIMGLSEVWVRWHSFAISISSSDKVIWERYGRVIVVERQINLAFAGSLTFKQNLMGRFFDYGSLSIGAMGGPYEWENLGHFRTLRRILESRGEWMPRPRLRLYDEAERWARVLAEIMRRIWRATRRIGAQMLRNPPRNQAAVSYIRFLHFVERTFFPRSARRFEQAFQFPNIDQESFSHAEVELYLRILRNRRVVISDECGMARRHERVSTLEDVRKFVPPDWFEMVIRQNQEGI